MEDDLRDAAAAALLVALVIAMFIIFILVQPWWPAWLTYALCVIGTGGFIGSAAARGAGQRATDTRRADPTGVP